MRPGQMRNAINEPSTSRTVGRVLLTSAGLMLNHKIRIRVHAAALYHADQLAAAARLLDYEAGCQGTRATPSLTSTLILLVTLKPVSTQPTNMSYEFDALT